MENLKKILTHSKKGYIPVPRELTLNLGLNAAVMLVELIDKYEFYLENGKLNKLGEFYYTRGDMEKATGLKRTQQETVIKKLISDNFIEYTTQKGMPKKRWFKLSNNISALLTEAITASKMEAEKIDQKTEIEVKRCTELIKPVNITVGRKSTNQSVENLPTVRLEINQLEGTKPTVNKNREKEQNIKTEQNEESLTLRLSDSVNKKDKDTEYGKKLLEKLYDKLSDTLGIEKVSIYNALEKANKDKGYSYKDLLLGYEFKEDADTINHILENPEINTNGYKFNSIIKSIINGVPDALANQKEEQLEYEEMNANIPIIEFHAQQIAMEKAMKAKEDVIIEDTIDFDILEDNIGKCKKEDTKINTNPTDFMHCLNELEKKQA